MLALPEPVPSRRRWPVRSTVFGCMPFMSARAFTSTPCLRAMAHRRLAPAHDDTGTLRGANDVRAHPPAPRPAAPWPAAGWNREGTFSAVPTSSAALGQAVQFAQFLRGGVEAPRHRIHGVALAHRVGVDVQALARR